MLLVNFIFNRIQKSSLTDNGQETDMVDMAHQCGYYSSGMIPEKRAEQLDVEKIWFWSLVVAYYITYATKVTFRSELVIFLKV